MTTPQRVKKIPTPASMPASAFIGMLSGFILIAVGVIAARDLMIRLGWIDGVEWIREVFAWLGRLSWTDWMFPIAGALIAVGLVLLWISLKPRHSTHREITSGASTWTRNGDVARKSSSAARGVDGVETASTTAGNRKVVVKVVSRADAEVKTPVTDAVTNALGALSKSPKVKVKVKRKKESL